MIDPYNVAKMLYMQNKDKVIKRSGSKTRNNFYSKNQSENISKFRISNDYKL